MQHSPTVSPMLGPWLAQELLVAGAVGRAALTSVVITTPSALLHGSSSARQQRQYASPSSAATLKQLASGAAARDRCGALVLVRAGVVAPSCSGGLLGLIAPLPSQHDYSGRRDRRHLQQLPLTFALHALLHTSGASFEPASGGAGSKSSSSGGSGSEVIKTSGKPVPGPADCDEAIGDYEDLKRRLNQLQRPSTLRRWDELAKDLVIGTWKGTVAVVKFTVSVPGRIQAFRQMPAEEWKAWKAGAWATVKHEAHHYWVGTKLLWFDTKIAARLAFKAARGDELTRRERAQLTRTTADIFRLVPFIIIIVIPFMELALPLLLRLFPNLLPSTYEDKLKKEEELKRRLTVRLELARFLQDTVAEMAKDLKRRSTGAMSATAADLYDFINKVRAGAAIENSEILRFAQLFNDELTLDNLERLQLVSMCQFVGISPFGSDHFLRNRLRQHLAQIKHDDYMIEKEGLENLTEDELRQACRSRGMRAPFGEGAVPFLRRQLHDWLDLSLHRGLPSSLLLLSRAFTITAPVRDVATKKDLAYEKVKETLGVIPEEVVERVELETLATGAMTPEQRVEALQRKLDLLKREEERIKAEAAAVKAAAKAAAAAVAAAKAATAIASGVAAPSAAAAAAASHAVGVATATAATVAAPAEAAQAAAATAATTMLREALKVDDVVSKEEKEAKVAAEKERKIAAIIQALMDLATTGGVGKERTMFMGLVKNEISRMNESLAETGGSKAFVFTNRGLQVGGAAPQDEVAAQQPAPAVGLPSGLTERIGRMLHQIEKELDSVEAKIGDSMRVLDADGDGVVSREELERAISFLREQLDEEDLQLLFRRLGAVAGGGEAGAAANGIPVDQILAKASGTVAAPKESVQIHTM